MKIRASPKGGAFFLAGCLLLASGYWSLVAGSLCFRDPIHFLALADRSHFMHLIYHLFHHSILPSFQTSIPQSLHLPISSSTHPQNIRFTHPLNLLSYFCTKSIKGFFHGICKSGIFVWFAGGVHSGHHPFI